MTLTVASAKAGAADRSQESQPGGAAQVVATDRHPFWSVGARAWVDARDLVAGDQLLTAGGERVLVTAVRHWTALSRVHNLSIAGTHTYYVQAGTTPVLAHNCGQIPWSSGHVSSAAKALDNGATGVTVRSRSEAEELFLGKYQGAGYRNASGFDGKGTRQYFGE